MKRLLIATLLIVLTGGVAMAAKEKDDDRGYIGVTVVGVNNAHEGEGDNGVYIGTVHEGSGAEAAGLLVHDRILTVNGVHIATVDDLDTVLDTSAPGQDVQLGFARDGSENVITLTLGGAPIHESFVWRQHGESEHGKWVIEMIDRPRIGLQMQPLTAQLAGYFGVESGVLITEVTEDSAAWEAGLQAGDVLLDIDGESVKDPHGVQRIVHHREGGDIIDISVQRRGQLERFAVEVQEGLDLSANEMTFNVALDSGHTDSLDYQGNVTIEVADGDMDLSGQSVTIRLSTDDDPEALRIRIHELKKELLHLEHKLHSAEND